MTIIYNNYKDIIDFKSTDPPSTLSSSKSMIGDMKSDLDVKLPTFPSGLKY